MKVKKQLRQKRIKQFNHLYNVVTSNLDYYYGLIYKEIKKMTKDNKVKIKNRIIELILDSLKETKFLTEKELEKIFPNSFERQNIDIYDILYKQDGLNLVDRIDKWFNQTEKKEQLSSQITRILNTQTYHAIPIITKKSLKRNNDEKIYVEISPGGDCWSGICDVYADGDIHPQDDIDLPPYHPNCECTASWYETDEVEI